MTDEHRIFSFFLIAEGECVLANEKTCVMIDGEKRDVSASLKNVTCRGTSGDNQDVFSGLYQVKICLPHDITRKSCVAVHYSYEIPNNISKNVGSYDFVIIPQNYGKKIRRFGVQISTSGEIIQKPEVYKLGPSGKCEFVDMVSFKSNQGDYQYHWSGKPEMNSAYSIPFSVINGKI